MADPENTPVPAAAADPETALAEALANGPEKAKADARKAFSAIADAGRPWEQLPSLLKACARQDVATLTDPVKAGYSARTASILLRETGRA